jgi:hypothetical protein
MITIPAPMLATAGGKPFTDAGWIYEVKYDGYGCMARRGGGAPAELRTKSGVDCTKWFPEVAIPLEKLPGGPHLNDGEACVLDDVGRSDFECLQERARRRRCYAGCKTDLPGDARRGHGIGRGEAQDAAPERGLQPDDVEILPQFPIGEYLEQLDPTY